MKKVILIGTVHLNWTPHKELIEEIKKYHPDKLFIELTEKEVKDGKENSNRDEMFAARDFAIEAGVSYFLFDTDSSILKAGVTGDEPGFVKYEAKVKELLADFNWQTLNSEKPWHIPEVKTLEDYLVREYFDKDLLKARESLISTRIKENLAEGVNVIVTGCGHLTHLLRDIPGSTAPLRDSS